MSIFRPFSARRIAFVVVMLCISVSCVALGQAPADELRWMGRGGEFLPFESDEDVLEFLRRADIVSLQDLPSGVTQSRVVTLEENGVRARAAFHTHHKLKERQRMADGSIVEHFRDSYTSQVAAYEVALLLGMRNTPPTVLREIDGQEGSLQLWIENTRRESDRRSEGLAFPDPERAYRQVYDMDVFDALINNLDRSQGNFLWGRESWDLWLIDHTRAFGSDKTVLEQRRVTRCSRRLWKNLQQLDTAVIEERLEPYLSELERSAVVARWRDLVELIDELIEKKGEDEVLFEYDELATVSR